jgi:hypothetical protein
MADLSRIEKTKLEKLFGIGSGYVLDFSTRTLAEFVLESTGKDIYDEGYNYGSGSKANRLREFWNEEPNHIVSKLVTALLEYHKECSPESLCESLYQDCRHIAQRLQQSEPVQEIEAISPNLGGRDFEALAKSVREAIERNEPESGLDRLHTFVVKYIKVYAISVASSLIETSHSIASVGST